MVLGPNPTPASNPPAINLTTASIVSLYCNLRAEQH
jgi:hypothetical protein